jgi:hypothetical protein
MKKSWLFLLVIAKKESVSGKNRGVRSDRGGLIIRIKKRPRTCHVEGAVYSSFVSTTFERLRDLIPI